MSSKPMQRARVDGAELEFEVTGTGEPVLLIHGALIAEAYAPLCAEPALNSRYRLVRIHRRGYAGSSPARAPFSLAEQAAGCRGLLRHLGIERAHVVGHSSGAVIALRLALDAPEVVHSLVLLEPALLNVPSGALLIDALGPVMEQYGAGDKEGAADSFLRLAIGSDYRAWLDRLIPGACQQLVADADTYFGVELPPCRSGSSRGRTPGGSPSPSSACSVRRAPRFGPGGTRFRSGCVSGCHRPSRSCSRVRTTRYRRRTLAVRPRP
jgi:pimeloyl-ACP methyl ester carboxylesterase